MTNAVTITTVAKISFVPQTDQSDSARAMRITESESHLTGVISEALGIPVAAVEKYLPTLKAMYEEAMIVAIEQGGMKVDQFDWQPSLEELSVEDLILETDGQTEQTTA